MNTRTLDNPTMHRQRQRIVLNVASRKYDFLMELLQNFKFVQVEENDGDTREEIIANLKGASKDLELIKAGKLKGRPARELLNEI